MEPFTYTRKSQFISYKGQFLDSLLELKFILMMEDTHAWLRDGIEIYYDLDTLESALFGRLFKYSPDFLVRNWQTGKATLIEIKPEGYDNFEKLHKRQRIANHFITQFGYDWDYKVIFGNEIELNQIQHLRYYSIINTFWPFSFPYMDKLEQNNTSLFDTAYSTYVRSGVLPASPQ